MNDVEWETYWNFLTAAEKDEEIRMMAEYVEQIDELAGKAIRVQALAMYEECTMLAAGKEPITHET